jgi:hypothetical protein
VTEHLLVYAALALTPAAAFYGVRRAVEWFSRPRRRRGAPSPPPDLARLTTRLRRLDEEFRRVERDRELPGRSMRLRTVHLAYDDTLCACCDAAGLPSPGTPPLPANVRLQTEAALAQRGVLW